MSSSSSPSSSFVFCSYSSSYSYFFVPSSSSPSFSHLHSSDVAAEQSEGNQYQGTIYDILAVMLYNFCNAFPTLLHEWMWLALHVLQFPKHLIKGIGCLFSCIKAFFPLAVELDLSCWRFLEELGLAAH